MFYANCTSFIDNFKPEGRLKRLPQLVLIIILLCITVSYSYAEEPYPADAVWTPPGAHFSAVKIYDAKGRLITRLLPEGREFVRISQIPVKLRNALVAVEDHRFYSHHGVDILGVGRALVKNIMKGRVVEGGSTITQQLVKNMLLSNERTVSRKLKEGVLALEFEQKYTKDQILEMYFNYVYFGNGSWGVQQAARLYFDKNVSDLTLAECAVLAGIPKSPNKFNPLADKVACKTRRNLVLEKMVENGYINAHEQAGAAKTALSGALLPKKSHFSEYMKHKLVTMHGDVIISTGGYKVYSTLDLDLQRVAEQAFSNGFKRLESRYPKLAGQRLQGSFLAIDPHNGHIKAVIGGRDFASSPYNRAFYAKRQPGSSFKPFIYAAAVERGFTVSSMWNDSPVSYDRGNGKTWEPANFENKYFGKQSLRDALADSNNVITVKLLEAIDIQPVKHLASRLGISSPLAVNLSLALGTSEVSLQELVYAYGAFANAGQIAVPQSIIRIDDPNGKVLFEGTTSLSQAISPETAYLVTDMLRGVVDFGTGRSIRKWGFKKICAGKTGTTDECNDAWFIGFVPDLVAGFWVGFDNPRSMGSSLTGGAACAPMWAEFMQKTQKYVPATPFIMPETLITAEIDQSSGLLATSGCPEKKTEIFVPGTEPVAYCQDHGPGFRIFTGTKPNGAP